MREAMQAGGNRIVTGGQGEAPVRRLSLPQALELLRAGRPEGVVPQLANLGLQVMPLLQLLDKEFGLNLPLTEIERRLSERTR
jgi:hypothetical protein